MQRIAEFQRISMEQFSLDFIKSFPYASEDESVNAYESIVLPTRATKGSAGYDFSLVHQLKISPGDSVCVPTGLRSKIAEGWVLLIVPKSGLGVRYRLQLDNTVGVIDSDYYNANNEGHILIQVTNDSKSNKVLTLESGKAFAQGIFLPFGITDDDDVCVSRTGGFGSTGV